MKSVNYSELRLLHSKLANKSNQSDYDLIMQVAESYQAISFSSAFDLSQEEGILESAMVDWKAHVDTIGYLSTAGNLKQTFKYVILTLNQFLSVGNYKYVADLSRDALKTMDSLDENQRRTILYVWLLALTKSGFMTPVLATLHEFAPQELNYAMQVYSKMPDDEKYSAQMYFDVSVIQSAGEFIDKEISLESFRDFCTKAVFLYQEERDTSSQLDNNFENTFDYCFQSARELHKRHFYKLALNYYALAFALNPESYDAEYNTLVCLHRMSENQLVYNRAISFFQKDPRNPQVYTLGGIAAILTGNYKGLNNIIMLARQNQSRSMILDLLEGFLYEIQGNESDAKKTYEKAATANPQFKEIFLSRVRRINLS